MNITSPVGLSLAAGFQELNTGSHNSLNSYYDLDR